MNCIICGHNSFSIKYETSFFDVPVSSCNECGLSTTQINATCDLRKLYKKQYWDERDLLVKPDYGDVESLGKYRNWLSQYKYCKNFFNQKRTILEIGAGQGQASFWFEREKFIVTAVEPDKRNAELINHKLRNGKVITSFVEEFSTCERFDIIWMSHVLEHLERPDKFLNDSKNWLADDGVFFIEVPNCDNRSMFEASIKEPHLYHFTESTLSSILKNSDYNIVSSGFFRPATKIEGILNKIRKNYFPYYPRIQTDKLHGRDLRFIISK